MAFEITKTFIVKASAAAVWEFLIDPYRVAKCLPGAAVTEKLDDKTYQGTMTVKVGPVSSSYRGKIVFDKLDAGARVAEIAATGQDVKGRGGADLRLKSSVRELGPAECEITAASTVNITGILAQMGRGMVQDVSDSMFQIFSQRVRAELESTPAASPPPAAAPEPTAAPLPLAPAPAPAPVLAVAAAPAAPPEALDLGSLGAKVAGRMAVRTLTNPVAWIAVLVVAGGLYLIFRR